LLENARHGGEAVSLLVASEKTAASLARALEQKSVQALLLPEIAAIEETSLDED
jgi:hypothetical protein